MKETIRNVLAVVLLTATIWVWADLEQQHEQALVVPVEVNVPPGFVVLRLTPDRVKVWIRGPVGEIQALDGTPEGTPDLKVCRFALTDPEKLQSGTLRLRASDGFRQWNERRLSVVAVTTVADEPIPEITVEVGRLVDVSVPVVVRVTGAIAAETTVKPPEVKATVREAELAEVPQTKRYAVAPVEIKSIPDSRVIEETVTLDPRLGGAEGIEATFTPKRVTVTVTLVSAVVTKALPQVPITIAMPIETMKTYQVVFQDTVPPLPVDLKIEGPREIVERLTPGQVSLQLVITPADKPVEQGTWIGREPRVVGLPVEVKAVEALPTVNFNLKRRTE